VIIYRISFSYERSLKYHVDTYDHMIKIINEERSLQPVLI
jgi:hypothetical protein